MKAFTFASILLTAVVLFGCSGEPAPVDGDSPAAKGVQAATGPVGMQRAGKQQSRSEDIRSLRSQ